jgi:hypothetical protein
MRQQRWMYKGRDWLEAKMIEKWNERTGYTAVDMTTAAAQGFRDGVASKSEPCDGCFMADAEALSQNADRYQVLRNGYLGGELRISVQYENTRTGMRVLVNGEQLDAIVDGAMSKEG